MEVVGVFDPHNRFHPCRAVLDALNVVQVKFIDPGSKPGNDDWVIKSRLGELAHVCGSAPSKNCVALVGNDKDFASEVKGKDREKTRSTYNTC